MLIKTFIPHKKNDYHPYILRPIGLTVVIVIILLQPLIYNLVTVHRFKLIDYATAINSSTIIALTNQDRAGSGVAALNENAQLDSAAEAKAANMFALDYWAHNSPTGKTPWDFIVASGYRYSAAAENLAEGFYTSAEVVNAWMASPEHETNMMNPLYKDIGVAVMNGVLQGQQTTLVVTEYASPLTQATPTPTPTHNPAPPATTQTPMPTPTTPAAQTTTTITPSPTPPPASVAPIKTEATTASPSKTVSLSLVSRLADYSTLNWGQKVTVFLLMTLFFINVLKHTLVWRKQKRGYRHVWFRSHPLYQACLLLAITLTVLLSSFGVIA